MKTLIVARDAAHKALLQAGLNKDKFAVITVGESLDKGARFDRAIVCDSHNPDRAARAAAYTKRAAWLGVHIAPHLEDQNVEV